MKKTLRTPCQTRKREISTLPEISVCHGFPIGHTTSSRLYTGRVDLTYLPSTAAYQKGGTMYFKIVILRQFLTIEPHFVRKGWDRHFKITILPQFSTIEPHFVRKGCNGHLKIAILPPFLTIETHFVRNNCDGHLKIAMFRQFFTIEPHFVLKGCEDVKCQFYRIFLNDRTSFRAKVLPPRMLNRKFTSALDDQTSLHRQFQVATWSPEPHFEQKVATDTWK